MAGAKAEGERRLAHNGLERPDVRDFRGDINASKETARGSDGLFGGRTLFPSLWSFLCYDRVLPRESLNHPFLPPQPLLRLSVHLYKGDNTLLAIETHNQPDMSVVIRTAQDVAGNVGARIEHTTNRLLPPEQRERALENLRAFSERNPKTAVSTLLSSLR